MRRVTNLSIVLGAVLILLPWQICECDDEGPRLKAIWDHSDCHHSGGPPESPGGEQDDATDMCGDLFTFDASVGAPPQAAPQPGVAGPRLPFLPASSTGRHPPADTDAGPLIEPPSAGQLETPGPLATRLLL